MNHHISDYKNYLCPPGNGVYTVHTGGGRKSALHRALYQSDDPVIVQKSWLETLENYMSSSKICLLGATMDTGGGILRGCNWGPLFIREAALELLSHFCDLGDTRVIPHLLHDKYLNDETLKSCKKALYFNENSNLPVAPLSILEAFAMNFFKASHHSLVTLGGDHSVSYPVVSSWIKAQKLKNTKHAVIHFDAHTDLLSSRLGIDLCFGSWAYHCLELLEKPEHMVQIGIRSSGYPKSHWERTLGVSQHWAQEVKNEGAEVIAQKIIDKLKRDKIQNLYVSFDIDSLDTRFASATGTPESEGLTPDDCKMIIDKLASHFIIHSGDIVEVSPYLQTQNPELAKEPEATLASAKFILEQFIAHMKHD